MRDSKKRRKIGREMMSNSETDAGHDDVAILKALKSFVIAESQVARRAVLEREQHLLLTPYAESLFLSLIDRLKLAEDELSQQEAIQLEQLYAMLVRCRMEGIDAVWHEISEIERQYFAETLLIWLSLSISRQQRRFLEEHRELLQQESDALLSKLSTENARERKYIHSCRALLSDIRERGTPKAMQEAYVNANGGFMLNLPMWLEEVEYKHDQLVNQQNTHGNISEDISLLRNALDRTQHDSTVAPEIIAQLWKLLGDALFKHQNIEHSKDIENAINAYEQAMNTYTLELYPHQWAGLQHNLSLVYRCRVRGEHTENVSLAIFYSHAAHQVWVPKKNPTEWAMVHESLGNAYGHWILGGRIPNLEHAISHYNAALQIYTREDYPDEWAGLHNNLGIAYAQLLTIGRHKCVEQAIEHFKAALQVYTLQTHPRDWAMIQRNLGNAYSSRILGDLTNNIECAIAHFEAALQVYTRLLSPIDWAEIQSGLGEAKAKRLVGKRSVNLEQAIEHCESALQVVTHEVHPTRYRDIQLDLAYICFDALVTEAQVLGEDAVYAAYKRAAQAFAAARQVQTELGWETSSEQGRALLLGATATTREMYAMEAWCFYVLGDLRQAIIVLEAGRAQALGEASSIAGVVSESLCEEHAQTFVSVRQRLQEARASGDRLLIRATRTAFLQLRQEVRSHCQPDFLPDALSYQDIAESADPNHLLIYLASTDRGGFALVVPPRQRPGVSSEPLAITLPELTALSVNAWIFSLDSDENLLGGYYFALEHQHDELLDRWLYSGNNETETARKLALPLNELAEALPDSMVALRTAIRAAINDLQEDKGDNLLSVEKSLGEWMEHATLRKLLQRRIAWCLQKVELEHLLDKLSQTVMKPLRQELDGLGWHDPDQPLALIPCGKLGIFPFHAAPVREENIPFAETCLMTYQASARLLAASRKMSIQISTHGPLLAVGNPRPSSQEANLPYAEFEAQTITRLARKSLHPSSQCLIGAQATRRRVLSELEKIHGQHPGAWLHLAGHGHANVYDPNECYMLLSGFDAEGKKERLSLAMLQREGLLKGFRGVTASGCVTGLNDLHLAPDELGSFAAGLLQAGAPCVIATLWSVNDYATCLLMVRFHLLLINQTNISNALALREATRWLRTATLEQINAFCQELGLPILTKTTRGIVRGMIEPLPEKTQDMQPVATVNALFNEQEVLLRSLNPYDHPVYWAAPIITGYI